MPDLPNRSQEEAALAYLLMPIFEEFRDEALALLGDPPRLENLPSSYFERIASQVKGGVVEQLAGLHLEAAERMAASLDLAFDAARAARDAMAWAEQRAAELARDLANRIYEQIAEAVERAVNSEAAAATLAVIAATIFSEERATTIAVTETTGSVSAGEVGEARRQGREAGVTVTATWITERDGRVCKICHPLHAKPDSEWESQFPSGPPAHVNCRCYLEWDVSSGIPLPSEN